MDWFPLYNSIRIALIATAVTFFLGIFFAYYAARLPRALKGILDCILTLPLVMPPTVIGFFLLKTIGMNGCRRQTYIRAYGKQNNDDVVRIYSGGYNRYISAYVQNGEKLLRGL